LTPLTKKRLKAFRRIRRAWWSLMTLAGIFVFCLCADLVCPCDPKAVVDSSTLDKYRKPVVERVYDVKAARFSLPDGGGPIDYEGPTDDATRAVCEEAAARAGAGKDDGAAFDLGQYSVRVSRRDGYRRVYLDPKEPAAVTERVLPPEPVSFPFRPVPEHPFGIDAGGRDVYARVVHGMRIALLFGLVLSLSGMFFGLVIGATEGYFGGITDMMCQRFTEIWSAMPFL